MTRLQSSSITINMNKDYRKISFQVGLPRNGTYSRDRRRSDGIRLTPFWYIGLYERTPEERKEKSHWLLIWKCSPFCRHPFNRVGMFRCEHSSPSVVGRCRETDRTKQCQGTLALLLRQEERTELTDTTCPGPTSRPIIVSDSTTTSRVTPCRP